MRMRATLFYTVFYDYYIVSVEKITFQKSETFPRS